jgi:hypothetical protein
MVMTKKVGVVAPEKSVESKPSTHRYVVCPEIYTDKWNQSTFDRSTQDRSMSYKASIST